MAYRFSHSLGHLLKGSSSDLMLLVKIFADTKYIFVLSELSRLQGAFNALIAMVINTSGDSRVKIFFKQAK